MLIQQSKFYWISDRSEVAHLNWTVTQMRTKNSDQLVKCATCNDISIIVPINGMVRVRDRVMDFCLHGHSHFTCCTIRSPHFTHGEGLGFNIETRKPWAMHLHFHADPNVHVIKTKHDSHRSITTSCTITAYKTTKPSSSFFDTKCKQ